MAPTVRDLQQALLWNHSQREAAPFRRDTSWNLFAVTTQVWFDRFKIESMFSSGAEMTWLTAVLRELHARGWSLVIVTVLALVGLGAAVIDTPS